MAHGFTSLELFSELEEEDLDSLGVSTPEDRAKVLTAAQLLLDYEGIETRSLSVFKEMLPL